MSDDKGDIPPSVQGVQIEYPTYYTFKAMGLAGQVRDRMIALVAAVVGKVDEGSVTARPSSAGKYESISIHVYLRSEEERRAIYHAFHAEKAFVWYV